MSTTQEDIFKKCEIVALGSCCVDQVFLLDTLEKLDIFSREGSDKQYFAVEVSSKFNVKSVNFYAGGSAANIAVDLAILGLKTAFFGGIGTDPPAQAVLDDFVKHKVDITGLHQFSDTPTGLSIIISADGKEESDRSIMAFKGASDKYSKVFCQDDLIEKSRAFVWTSLTSDCGLEAINHCIDVARASNSLVVGAPSISIIQKRRAEVERFVKKCHVVSMNEEELKAITEEIDVPSGMRKLLSLGVGIVFVTLGKRGGWIADKRFNRIIKTTPPEVIVKDTTGAGDAALAGLIYGLLRGDNIERCGLYASAMGALEVASPGVRKGLPESHHELLKFLEEHPMPQETCWL